MSASPRYIWQRDMIVIFDGAWVGRKGDPAREERQPHLTKDWERHTPEILD